jgi:hypothetical protein
MMEQYILAGRRRRFEWIEKASRHSGGRAWRILDVGGTVEYWSSMPWQALAPVEVVLLNVMPQATAPPFTAVVGDARDLSRYDDQSFDVAYSNSVIGHVGSIHDQRRMAAELQRVGRHVILQTPNHWFPIDWRTLVPGFHFLPVTLQAWCLHHARIGRYARVRDAEEARRLAGRVRNLTRGELAGMFPRAEIHRERAVGFTKSFVVVRPGSMEGSLSEGLGNRRSPRPDTTGGADVNDSLPAATDTSFLP